MMAEGGEPPGRRRRAGGDLGVNRIRPETRHEEDALPPDGLRHHEGRHGAAERVPCIRRGQQGKQGDEVGAGAGDRPDLLEVEQDRGQPVAARYPARRRLQPDQPGMRGRPADRAAAIRPKRERAEPGRHRGNRPAGGAARRQRHVPRVARRAEDRVVGIALQGEFGDVGLAQQYQPCGAEPRHRQLVPFRDEFAEERAAPGAGQAGDGDVVLCREGHAIQRRERQPGPPAPGAGLGGGAGAGLVERDDGVEAWVQPSDTGQHRLQRLDRRERPLGEATGQGGGGEQGRVAHATIPRSRTRPAAASSAMRAMMAPAGSTPPISPTHCPAQT